MSAAPKKRVALYGGSFNPVHVCHVLVATWVLCREDVDALVFVPVFNHAFGKSLAPFEDRCHMLELATAHLGPAVSVSTIERDLGDGPSYTIDTVQALLKDDPALSLRFVCGTDVYAQRARWKSWDILDDLLDFIVIGREGEPPVYEDDGSLVSPRTTLPDVSSSAIRAAIADGRYPAGMLPRAVQRYIRDKGLYGGR